jgi:hypothetical protein
MLFYKAFVGRKNKEVSPEIKETKFPNLLATFTSFMSPEIKETKFPNLFALKN